MHFQTSSLQPPHAPLSRLGFWLRSGLAPDSLGQLSAVRRTSLITRSLVSRIRPYRVRIDSSFKTGSSTGCLFASSCSPPHLAVTQLLSATGGKLRQRGTLTLPCTLSLKRTSTRALACPVGASPTDPASVNKTVCRKRWAQDCGLLLTRVFRGPMKRRIPKGFRPKVQGCEERATLGRAG